MNASHIVEVGEVAAGIVIQERPGRFRFYASQSPFRSLEPRVFTGVEQAVRAAYELLASARDHRTVGDGRKSRPASVTEYFI